MSDKEESDIPPTLSQMKDEIDENPPSQISIQFQEDLEEPIVKHVSHIITEAPEK